MPRVDRHDEGDYPLTPLRVGPARHRYLADGRVPAEDAFYGDGPDIFPTGDDHVGEPAADLQPALPVKLADVAGGGTSPRRRKGPSRPGTHA